MSVCELPCDPCPKYCRRAALPYVGYMGWGGYVVESLTLVWISLMVVGVAPQDWKVVMGLLITTILVDLLFWVVNLFKFAPCFSLQTLKCCDNPCGIELIVKGDACDYAVRMKHEIPHNNDQGHLQSALLSGCAVFLVFGIFVGKYGTGAFEILDATADENDFMFYVISKVIQVLIVVAYASGFRYLTETTSDLIFRHITALPENTKKSDSRVYDNNDKKGSFNPRSKNVLNSL